jgi:hypothetical protein
MESDCSCLIPVDSSAKFLVYRVRLFQSIRQTLNFEFIFKPPVSDKGKIERLSTIGFVLYTPYSQEVKQT